MPGTNICTVSLGKATNGSLGGDGRAVEGTKRRADLQHVAGGVLVHIHAHVEMQQPEHLHALAVRLGQGRVALLHPNSRSLFILVSSVAFG